MTFPQHAPGLFAGSPAVDSAAEKEEPTGWIAWCCVILPKNWDVFTEAQPAKT